jgi:hypothetical protein
MEKESFAGETTVVSRFSTSVCVEAKWHERSRTEKFENKRFYFN